MEFREMKRILIVDDDPVMIKLLDFNLKKAGYAVTACQDGSSVEKMAEQTNPDLAVFDLILPGRSGLKLVQDFRKNTKFKTLPIIIITQKGNEHTKENLLNAGATCVFTKPFSPKLVLQTINNLTKNNSIVKDYS